ncbi:MAG: tetraacyldisaccharide 4'-kinase [Candidatus Omnitrophica bacterium]|nr:tetraacyldisaccharide 4'-kinase [Candidatus Omnitrophota bacterium]
MIRPVRNYLRFLAEGRENGTLSQILFPFLWLAEGIYGKTVEVARSLHEKKILPRKRLPFPVISIGNLTWGGTGKTPLVEYLARKASAHNKNVLILTRGYGKDEVEQLRNNLPRVMIGVGADRAAVAAELAKKHKIDLAILDDGFQHWPLERDLEIITVNALNPFGNRRLLPRGILREPAAMLNKASVIVITHADLIPPAELTKLREEIQKLAPKAQVIDSCLEPLFFYRAHKRSRLSVDRLQKHKVTTFSGVGTPRSFQLLLSHFQIRPIRNFEFPDHHHFSEKELGEIKKVSESASSEEIITTEKDFYRAPEIITRVLNPLVLAVRLKILKDEEILAYQIFRSLGVIK